MWDQIKSNSASSSSSSPGHLARSQGNQILPSYASIAGPPGAANGGDREELGMLRPVSDGEEGGDEREECEETRGVPDLDVRNRKWRKNIEHALVQMTTELAALREQLETKRIGDGRRRNGLWAWMTWLVWVTVRHLVVDLALLGLLVVWARKKEDRGVEQGLEFLLQYLRHRIRKIRMPSVLRIPSQRT